MNDAKDARSKHWPVWRLVLMYCVVMNLLRGFATAMWTTIVMGNLAQFPMLLVAYLLGMVTVSALVGGLLAVASHVFARRVTTSSLVVVLGVTIVTTIAQLVVIRDYVQSLNALIFQVILIAPFVALVAWYIVWRESKELSANT
jgi:hypothetical protein